MVLLSALWAALAIASVSQKSLTIDEMKRLAPGYLHLTAGEFRIHTDHPPLVKMLAALPLLAQDIRLPPVVEDWSVPDSFWPFFHDFLYVVNDADRLVRGGRLAVLPIAVVLGLFVFWWARALFGAGAACFALLLYAFEPNILAHGPLMNTDVPVTGFLFATTYFFARALDEVTLGRVVLAGVCYGLALVTKYSAVFGLLWLVALGAGVACSTRFPVVVTLPRLGTATLSSRRSKLAAVTGTLVAIGLVAYVVVWAVYRFRFEGGITPGYAYLVPWGLFAERPDFARRLVLWARGWRLLPDAYLHGLALATSTSTGRLIFLMGEVSTTGGWWHYFVVTFGLKTPLAFLLLLGFLPWSLRRWWSRAPLPILCLVVPPLVYFGVASASRLNIGHRHILPIYPFLFVLAASVVPWALARRPIVKAGVALLAAWYVVSSASVFPHYLAYFNELAGGPDGGWRYLVDSNLDWGQDLKGLKRYMDEHAIKRIWLSYFGTADPRHYGIEFNYFPSLFTRYFHQERAPAQYLAVSVSNLRLLLLHQPESARRLRELQLEAKIGHSIFLYRIP